MNAVVGRVYARLLQSDESAKTGRRLVRSASSRKLTSWLKLDIGKPFHRGCGIRRVPLVPNSPALSFPDRIIAPLFVDVVFWPPRLHRQCKLGAIPVSQTLALIFRLIDG